MSTSRWCGRLSAICVFGIAMMAGPPAARAQGTSAAAITGVVKDASGAVMPGVTVEASSPALIEQVRSTVNDGQGQYQIIELRPGTYTVSFALQGFATLTKASRSPRTSRQRSTRR